ncbi:FSH1-domain-containing protein [Exidia glandulosa HHB12029]|uniref:FSH1-domain-containing protein n=1 Tax=Exidia glandulosa HHB12029 TaxID=1314781 RepID=A0A165F180_EXIGL|nr:FSH1-domain-containing protein [Exidia glandulosa HHB12029]
MRILALHGYTQNSHIFSKRLGAIRKACGKECEFVFLDGPHVLTLADVNFGNMDVQETQPEPTDPELIPRAWWRSDEAGTKYRGLEESLLYLRDHLVKEKYNGVFGFSQGATMAALLAAVLERPALAAKYNLLTDGQMSHPPFEFCVVVAGFIPRDPSLAGIFTEASVDGPAGLHTRSLHIIGATDILVTPERSQPLIDASTKARVEQHLGGHFVPATGPWRTFFKAYLNAKSDDEAAAVPSPSSTNSGTSTPVTSAL